MNCCVKQKQYTAIQQVTVYVGLLEGILYQKGGNKLCFSWFQTFAVFWIYYVFFWVFPRRLIVVCRRFGTLYRFHLQGLDVEYEKWAEDVVFIYQGWGLLELAEPMGRGAAGSGRFRVGEKVWRGRYKSRVSGCGPVIVCSTLHTLHPALEDGADRGFRNVGIQQSETGETPKRIHNKFKTRRKFEIKNSL